MCRFISYIGCKEMLTQLLYEPENSLIKQSIHAKEMEEPLNGDGFGVGWYNPDLSGEPGLFTSISPAWNNQNLRYLSSQLESSCFFAHVRAASVGSVSQLNCHPFHYGDYLMMHNGSIENFEEIRRPLLEKISDERFNWIKGQTDSEHIFALFLDYLLDETDDPDFDDFCDAFHRTFNDLYELKEKYGLEHPSLLNLMVTNGHIVAGSRYITHERLQPHSLYISEGRKYECEDGVCRMIKTGQDREKAILVVSEKLTGRAEDWNEVEKNHFLMVDRNLNIDFKPIHI